MLNLLLIKRFKLLTTIEASIEPNSQSCEQAIHNHITSRLFIRPECIIHTIKVYTSIHSRCIVLYCISLHCIALCCIEMSPYLAFNSDSGMT